MYEAIRELERRGGRGVLCTVVRTRGSVPRHAGAKMLVYPDRRIAGTIGGGEMEDRVIGDAVESLQRHEARIVRYTLRDPGSGDPGVCGGEVEVFLEPLTTHATLLVVGAGHVGRALVHLGKWLGFRVVLSDDRAELCSPAAAPGADAYLGVPISQLPQQFEFTDQTCIVLATRGYPLDVEALPQLLDVPHAYLGVIGSRRRWATAFKQLEQKGIARTKLERVHAPMGLELHAETPEEIALSILAEIVMVRNAASGKSMRWSGDPTDA